MSPRVYEQVAWAWTEHLRHGGTTRWSDWAGTDHRPDHPPDHRPGTAVPRGWSVPGAAQLEVVRRLAVVSHLDDAAFTRLADLVLDRSAPGRGLAPQPLAWPDPPAGRRFGAPPVDPCAVPEEELLRVSAGVLAELTLRVPQRGEPTPRRRSRFSARVGFEVVAAPVTAAAVRQRLAAAGHREGGRLGKGSRVAVVVEPFDDLLAQVWSARVQDGAPVRWRGFVQRWSGRPALPAGADLAGAARQWAEQVGPDRVHLVAAGAAPGAVTGAVTGAGTEAVTEAVTGAVTGAVTAAVADALGLPLRRPPRPRDTSPRWQDLSPAAVGVCRRVNSVLAVRVDQGRHRGAVGSLVRAVSRPGPHTPLTVPRRFQPWARSRAARLAEQLRSGGYRVHGDLDVLLPTFAGAATRPDPAEELALALSACTSLAEEWTGG